MPTIRVDQDVYRWLQSFAAPFEDNPNSVLRRLAGLDGDGAVQNTPSGERKADGGTADARARGGRLSAKILVERCGVPVKHALYHRDGMFFENLKIFPGALFDPNGYVLFHAEGEYSSSPYLRIGLKCNVRGGIASIPGYRRMQ